jgi:drug/metabolite transporter (DMT)-like permease
MRHSAVAGYLLAFLFVGLSAGRDVQASRLHDPAYLILLLAFLPTAVPAAVWAAARPAAPAAWSSRAVLAVVLLNLTTMGNWLAYIDSIRRIGPVIFAGIVVGLMPTMMLVLEVVFARRLAKFRDAAAAFAVLTGVLLVATHNRAGSSTEASAFVGPLVAVFTSFTAAATNFLVRQLQGYQVGAVATFGLRFWGLILVSVVMGLVESERPPAAGRDWLALVLFGVLGIAVPLFCLQSSIRHLGPATPTLLFTLHPACVLLLESATGGYRPVPLDWVGVALIGVGILTGLASPRVYRPIAATSLLAERGEARTPREEARVRPGEPGPATG